jgi:hypothetical protein
VYFRVILDAVEEKREGERERGEREGGERGRERGGRGFFTLHSSSP